MINFTVKLWEQAGCVMISVEKHRGFCSELEMKAAREFMDLARAWKPTDTIRSVLTDVRSEPVQVENRREMDDAMFHKLRLAELEDKWSERHQDRCAICGGKLPEADPPLLLWRKDGKEGLAICWPCVEERMK